MSFFPRAAYDIGYIQKNYKVEIDAPQDSGICEPELFSRTEYGFPTINEC